MTTAIFGDVADPGADRHRGGRDLNRGAAQQHLPRIGRPQAEDHFRQLGPAGADEPRNPENLAAADR